VYKLYAILNKDLTIPLFGFHEGHRTPVPVDTEGQQQMLKVHICAIGYIQERALEIFKFFSKSLAQLLFYIQKPTLHTGFHQGDIGKYMLLLMATP
jgi:hypothetical protein